MNTETFNLLYFFFFWPRSTQCVNPVVCGKKEKKRNEKKSETKENYAHFHMAERERRDFSDRHASRKAYRIVV